MNLGGLIFGFAAICLIMVGTVFVITNQDSVVVDTYGGTYSEQANKTNEMLGNVTNTGASAAGFGVLVIAGLVLIGGVGMVLVYSKK
jgi:hypothetical protein